MTNEPAELRLRSALRDYVREQCDGGIVGDWLLVAHYIPADGDGDSYIVTGREGLPEHCARGILDYARDTLPEFYYTVAEFTDEDIDEPYDDY